MARKCSRNGLKVGMRCCFVVSRPPAKFHRIRSPFDALTDNYSGSIAGLTSDVFGPRKQSPGLSSSLCSALCLLHYLSSARPNLTSLVSSRPSSRARPKAVPMRPGQSSPLDSDHPRTSTKRLRFSLWATQPIFLDRPFSIGGTRYQLT